MMKRGAVLLLLVIGVAFPATAAAAIADFWKLGYRAADPFPGASTFERTVDWSQRYMVRVDGYFTVRRNPRGENVRVYLPLPADDAYQRVYTSRMQPAPVEILHSRYGYQIAVFDFGPLARGREFSLRYDAYVSVGKIRWSVDPQEVGDLSEIPAQVREDYLIDGPFYGMDDPVVQAAAREAVGDERRPFFMMTRILSYVHQSLTYILDGRKVDAGTTLQWGHGSCTEHAFVMIGMARSLGLPVRYMAGSLVKTGTFSRHHYDRVYHKIVEVYLPRVGWVPVETTAGRRRAEFEPDTSVGRSGHRMLFFSHEPEPGLAPLDPRRNIMTHRPYGIGSELSVGRQVTVHWEHLR
ncbi:MAG: transglutaminase family protein [Candidatus Lernaella stagnicola]|nr:transglutaminase family protein [Candidatus Lernaella stagnicola]